MELHSEEAHIDGVLDDDAGHICVFLLADTEDATESLLFDGVVPPEVERDAAICPGEVETVELLSGFNVPESLRTLNRQDLPQATALQTCDQDLDVLIFPEPIDDFSSVFQGSVACEV
jgi:hypothetical protein